MKNIIACILISLAFTQIALASDLTLESLGPLESKEPEGKKVAVGQIICSDIHTGFKIWADAQSLGGAHYIIQGKSDRNNTMRVRIVGNGWSDDPEGKGVIKMGTETQTSFVVIIDGGQNISADEYKITVSGGCIVPD